MPTTIHEFSQIKLWKIMPLYYVEFYFTDHYIKFSTIEKGAEIILVPIMDTDDRGLERIVAYEFNGTLSIIQNDIQNMATVLNLFAKSNPTDIHIHYFPANSSQQNPGEMTLKLGANTDVNALTVNFSMADKVTNPQLQINFKGIFSADLLDSDHFATFLSQSSTSLTP